ncbi:MAG: response regulator [Gammaproteobacteria bacterium]|jgi:FixJ family two-component response regulator|nr:response regulator [Gammaproteobacteria bacterium]
MTHEVFIVDDDAAVRDALSLLLRNNGMHTEAFANGSTFLQACEHQDPGCVLLDMAMPGMNGHEVLATMNERGLQIPVIFLSGYGDIAMAVRAMQLGAVDFLEKPISGAELIRRLQSALMNDEERRKMQLHIQTSRQSYSRLSPREREVMALVVSGLLNKEIARQLQLSPRTVEVHRIHVMHKMGISNIAELVSVAGHCKI